MKKLISFLTAVSVVASMAAVVSAADKAKAEPDVFVNDSMIMFEDQNAVIVNDVTLVPARGVFEAMGCDVDWDGNKRTVTVTSDTGVREVTITIDSDLMKIGTYKTIMKQDVVDYTLEVPAQILNDRTMIPLRAVSEAMGCTVEWDGDAYAVNITKGERILLEGASPKPTPAPSERLKMSLSTDAEAVKAGEEFTVYVDAANAPEQYFLSGLVAVMTYDKDKLEYVEGSGKLMGDNGEPYEATIGVENVEYATGSKIVFINIDEAAGLKKSGHTFKATFKKLTDEPAEIALSNNFESVRGFESYFQYTTLENSGLKFEDKLCDGDDIIIDKTPLVIQ